MIGQLRGQVIDKQPPHILIDVNGVGYDVQVTMNTCCSLDLHSEATLLTHLSIRDDAHVLYGFISTTERHVFRILIKVSGVGPKLALTLLSGMNANELITCVQQQDTARLTQVPGIGKKTAERLIIETRDTLSQLANTTLMPQASTHHNMTDDALSALISLGYKPNEAKQAIQHQQANATSTETLIRLALQYLMTGVTS